MSGRIPKQFIDELLVRVDIVDLIEAHVMLKKTGSNYVARCPFHQEKTPSFNVNRNRQIFHCFGCGASGNAISFLMDFNHLDFVEAVEDLAAFAGVEVPREAVNHVEQVAKPDAVGLYQVLEAVTAFYVEQLKSAEGSIARSYLKTRGLNAEIISDYTLGYAPNSWDALLSRFDQKQLLDACLLVVKDDGKTYDRFRGRLMFPIRDKRKRVIGFGARVLDDSQPKYLNSPETVLFAKSKELYGLAELLAGNSRPKQILVVEGYMDVVALAQFGIVNVVATLGTATSKSHIDMLFRFTSELVFCFDGDSAGQQAAWKATEIALSALTDGRQIKIMLLPQGEDPDTLIRSEGVSAFQQRIVAGQVLSDYFFQQLSLSLNLGTMEGRAQLLASAKPQLEKVPTGFFREMMFTRLRELSGTKLKDISEKPTTLSRNHKQAQPSKNSGSKMMRTIIALLLQHPTLAKILEQQSININQFELPGIDVLQDVFTVIVNQKPENTGMLLEWYRNTQHYKVITALANLDLGIVEGDETTVFTGALNQLITQHKKNRMSAFIERLSRGETLTADEYQEFKTGGKN